MGIFILMLDYEVGKGMAARGRFNFSGLCLEESIFSLGQTGKRPNSLDKICQAYRLKQRNNIENLHAFL